MNDNATTVTPNRHMEQARKLVSEWLSGPDGPVSLELANLSDLRVLVAAALRDAEHAAVALARADRDHTEAKYNELRKTLHREVERRREAEARLTWRPIETAPKDGSTLVDLWCQHPTYGAMRATNMVYRCGAWQGHDGPLNLRWYASHWMPLPEAPADKSRGAMMSRFWDGFAKVRIFIEMPDGKQMAINESLSPLDREWLIFLPPPPPEFDHPQSHTELVLWQEQLRKSNEAADMLGQKIARALKVGFQNRIWEGRD